MLVGIVIAVAALSPFIPGLTNILRVVYMFNGYNRNMMSECVYVTCRNFCVGTVA